jgi:hypothetical protein
MGSSLFVGVNAFTREEGMIVKRIPDFKLFPCGGGLFVKIDLDAKKHERETISR